MADPVHTESYGLWVGLTAGLSALVAAIAKGVVDVYTARRRLLRLEKESADIESTLAVVSALERRLAALEAELGYEPKKIMLNADSTDADRKDPSNV